MHAILWVLAGLMCAVVIFWGASYLIAKRRMAQPWPDVGGRVSTIGSKADLDALLAAAYRDTDLLHAVPLVLLDCYALWCPPCRACAPDFARLSEAYRTVTFAKVDVDAAPDVARLLQVRSMPTFVLFAHSKVVYVVRGWSEGKLRQLLAEYHAAPRGRTSADVENGHSAVDGDQREGESDATDPRGPLLGPKSGPGPEAECCSKEGGGGWGEICPRRA